MGKITLQLDEQDHKDLMALAEHGSRAVWRIGQNGGEGSKSYSVHGINEIRRLVGRTDHVMAAGWHSTGNAEADTQAAQAFREACDTLRDGSLILRDLAASLKPESFEAAVSGEQSAPDGKPEIDLTRIPAGMKWMSVAADGMLQFSDERPAFSADPSGKPSWSQAPTWAQWLTQDYDGTWTWFSSLPEPLYGIGVWVKRNAEELAQHKGGGKTNDGWRDTLEQRPEVSQ